MNAFELFLRMKNTTIGIGKTKTLLHLGNYPYGNWTRFCFYENLNADQFTLDYRNWAFSSDASKHNWDWGGENISQKMPYLVIGNQTSRLSFLTQYTGIKRELKHGVSHGWDMVELLAANELFRQMEDQSTQYYYYFDVNRILKKGEFINIDFAD